MIKQKKRLKEAIRDNRRRGAGLSRYVSTPPRTASQQQPQEPNSGVQQAVNSVPRMPDGNTSYDLNAPPKFDQSSLPSSVKACEWLNISGCIFAYSYAPSSPKTECLDYVVPDTLPTRVRCRSGPGSCAAPEYVRHTNATFDWRIAHRLSRRVNLLIHTERPRVSGGARLQRGDETSVRRERSTWGYFKMLIRQMYN